jgi:hypothetical protein
MGNNQRGGGSSRGGQGNSRNRSNIKQSTIRSSRTDIQKSRHNTRERPITRAIDDVDVDAVLSDDAIEDRVSSLESLYRTLHGTVENIERELNLTKSIVFGVHQRPLGMTNDGLVETLLHLLGFTTEESTEMRKIGVHSSKYLPKAHALQIKWCNEHTRNRVYTAKKTLNSNTKNPFDPVENRRISITDSLTKRQVVEQGVTHRLFTFLKRRAEEKKDPTVYKKYSWSHIKVGEDKPAHYRQVAARAGLDWRDFERFDPIIFSPWISGPVNSHTFNH